MGQEREGSGAAADRVPFHKPFVGEEELAAVAAVIKSGWLTTGNECRRFEEAFAKFVGARYALAVNSCTAALHLALEAAGVRRGDRVIVPTLTFAATAEVVRYFDAVPIMCDIDPRTLNIDVQAAEALCEDLAASRRVPGIPETNEYMSGPARAILPVHYAGQMVDVDGIAALARRFNLRVIEDAAHALPAAARGPDGKMRSVGTTSEMTCFSFYANKTITTGEGGMLVTDDEKIADRARRMSLHGLSRDAWKRYAGGSWYYEILDAGFKYNMTDVAAAIGRVQLGRADTLRADRERIATRYRDLLCDVEEVLLPTEREDRMHSWHLYPLRLRLERLRIDRDAFIEELTGRGIGTSVHWMPLHLHPYYRDRFGYRPEHCPVAAGEWRRMISLPIFPSMTDGEIERVAGAVRQIAQRAARRRAFA